MKKNILKSILIISLLAMITLTACSQKDNKESSEITKIGISQIVEYRALDEAREGFLEALKDNGYIEGENLEIDFQNAQGEMPTTQTIAKSFASKKKDLIFAISTPSSQAAYNATKEIPIIMTAVTDPVAAGLVETLEKPNTNVSGTSDYIPVKKQLDLVKMLAPKAKKIGILYNTSEINSEVQVNQVKAAAPDYDYEIIPMGISTSNEINQAITSLANKIDVLYVPTDQLIVSAMPIIMQKTLEKKIPVIASEKGSVELGALATQGINYHKLGYQSGEMAVKVLQGEEISAMPIKISDETDIIINEKTLQALGIPKPQAENIIYLPE